MGGKGLTNICSEVYMSGIIISTSCDQLKQARL